MKRASRRLGAVLAGFFVLVAAEARGENASVCIDAGHGGHDPGAVGNGLQEKNLNLTASLAFREWLELDTRDTRGGGSWQVFMTRDDDTFVSLSGRADYANSHGADYFMCIHTNAGGGDGTETFAYASGTTADNLAHRVQEEVLEHLGTRDRGVKYNGFSVLVNTAMPAELNEMAFIDTWAGNAELLSDPANLDTVGLAHLHALQRMVGLAAYTPSDEPPPEPRGSISFGAYPSEVEAGTQLDVAVTYEANLGELGMDGQLVLEVKDAQSWEVIDSVVWNGGGERVVGPTGEHVFTFTAPAETRSIFFVAFITPMGAGWEGRLGDASTLEAPTSVIDDDLEIDDEPAWDGGIEFETDASPQQEDASAPALVSELPPSSMYGGCASAGGSPRAGWLLIGLVLLLGLIPNLPRRRGNDPVIRITPLRGRRRGAGGEARQKSSTIHAGLVSDATCRDADNEIIDTQPRRHDASVDHTRA